jgi:thiosulfate reductase cytochrome b subunit
MQYSDPDYPLIRFDISVKVHNITGVLLTIIYLVFLIGNMITENGKYYVIEKLSVAMKMISAQMKYYAKGMFKGENPPYPTTRTRKFNPLQKFSYISVMYLLMPILFITGWALLYPGVIITQVFNTSGVLLTSLLHVIVGFFVSLFLVIHVYFCTMGTKVSSLFKSMINGWHEVKA